MRIANSFRGGPLDFAYLSPQAKVNESTAKALLNSGKSGGRGVARRSAALLQGLKPAIFESLLSELKLRFPEKAHGSRSGGGSGAAEEKVAEAGTFALHAVKEAARPEEINGQQAQAEQNHEPTRARSHKEHDAEREQQKSAQDAKRSPRLLKRLENK